ENYAWWIFCPSGVAFWHDIRHFVLTKQIRSNFEGGECCSVENLIPSSLYAFLAIAMSKDRCLILTWVEFSRRTCLNAAAQATNSTAFMDAWFPTCRVLFWVGTTGAP
ncbi:unnamed protein product, partial [Scytosiphon promiscuus]